MSMVEELKKVLASRDEYLKSDSYAFNAYRRYQESCLEFFNGDHGQALVECVRDAERYRWLRDRMQVRTELLMQGPARDALSMRVGFMFLDYTNDPASGWTCPQNFDRCREKVDTAIDLARTKAGAGGGA